MNAFYTDPLCETLSKPRTWQIARQIDTHNVINAQAPQIAMDGHGNAIAVWTQTDGKRTSAWANRFVARQGWGRPQLIQTDSAGTGGHAQIAVDASGKTYALWTQSDGRCDHLVASHHTTHCGWAVPPPPRLHIQHTGDAMLVRLAVDASGSAIAVWQQYDGMGNTVLAAIYGGEK